jgi:N-acetylglutamate synthase-like GNAT family acetyltransferase
VVTDTLRLRQATLEDSDALERLFAASARGLLRPDHTEQQIEVAIATRMEVDTAVIRAGTFFVLEAAGEIVGCGAWSPWPKTRAGQVARIRGCFVHPNWARRGIGRRLLEECEASAREHGLVSAELMATLTGRRLYQACGYVRGPSVHEPLGDGLTIELVPMRKQLGHASR